MGIAKQLLTKEELADLTESEKDEISKLALEQGRLWYEVAKEYVQKKKKSKNLLDYMGDQDVH